jgi:hypothetical protein
MCVPCACHVHSMSTSYAFPVKFHVNAMCTHGHVYDMGITCVFHVNSMRMACVFHLHCVQVCSMGMQFTVSRLCWTAMPQLVMPSTSMPHGHVQCQWHARCHAQSRCHTMCMPWELHVCVFHANVMCMPWALHVYSM